MFKKMYASKLISVLYVFVAILITVGGLISLWRSFFMPTPMMTIAVVLAFLALQLIWRVLMEGSIVVYRIYEELVEIRKLLATKTN